MSSMGRDSATSLAPGFRFHPTDEELVRYYLKRKVSGKPLRFDAISVIDIYKAEPWDLPGKSKLKTRDLEWYFFSALDRKYGNSSRTSRATEKGYWKTTGKDRPVRHYSRTVGMKKTLVYHSGRAPRGARTNWVMHEYRLADEELEKAIISQDTFVLCRIFQKSGTGPKNGEKYGAPFIEEEWEDDEELALIPGQEAVDDENVDEGILTENVSLPSNFYYGETSNNDVQLNNFIEDDEKPNECAGETLELGETFNISQEQFALDANSVKDECFAESSNLMNLENVNYLLDAQYLGVPPFSDGQFLETNDLSNPIKEDPTGFDVLEEYLTFFDAHDDHMSFDPSEIMGGEEHVSDHPLPEKLVNEAAEPVPMASKDLPDSVCNNGASSLKQKIDPEHTESDTKHSFFKQASLMVGSIPAPPAFASEFPSKDVHLLRSEAQPSSSVHVTAGMILIRDMTSRGNLVGSLNGKNRDVDLILSFGVSQAGVSSSKVEPMVSGGFLFFFMLLWVLILSVSFKVGSCIYAR